MSSFFFITVLTIFAVTMQKHVESANSITYGSMVSSELIYQNYNFFRLLGKALNTDFTQIFSGNIINVTLHSNIKSGFDPLTKLANYNDFLTLYKTKLGIIMNYSMTDLLSDVSTNHKYVRTIYPNNVSITTNYQTNTIIYTNNQNINYYLISLSFNGEIKNITWTPSPAGTQVPITINGPGGYTATYMLNKIGNYTLRININNTIATNNIDFVFNYTSSTSMINYSSLANFNDVNLDFTTTVPSYGNVFKILSPYPNTRINLGFGDYSVSQGLE
ncbi:Uncharacterised protein [Candidatus Tiddalikarchaeum anstoanum]|nr:Uncharacterised protein [Candidatus Tiddalikarchaeum anstoanum]